jgi:hypothetical protein
MINEEKHQKFIRLARLRANRALKEIRLVGNLSNRNNYSYTESEVKTIISALEYELNITKKKFEIHKSKRSVIL